MPVIEAYAGSSVADHPQELRSRRVEMEGTQLFLELITQHGLAKGHLRGVFHIAIGRKLLRDDGSVVAAGVTWRELAAALKSVKFDKSLVKELGADPEALSVRDREKFWYAAIALAGVGSLEAHNQAERLADRLKRLGLHVSGFSAPSIGKAESKKSKK